MENQKTQEILQTVVHKAWNDEAFMQELVATPAQAIERVTGESFPIPAGTQIKVIDQTDPSYAYLNIPARPNVDDMELTDEQLELVAGGEFVLSAVIIVGTATILSGVVSYTVAGGGDKKK